MHVVQDGPPHHCDAGGHLAPRIPEGGAWGTGGREVGQLAYPWGVAVDKDDRVVAVDAGNNRLQVFSF